MNKNNEVIKSGKMIESAFNIEQGIALAAAMAFCGCLSPDMPQLNGVTNETGVVAE